MKLPRLLHGDRRRIFARLVVNGLAQAGAAIGVAFLVRRAFDRMPGDAAGALGWEFFTVMGALVLAIGLALVLRIVERIDAARLGESYITRIRLRLFDALNARPALADDRRGFGPTMLRFASDLTAVRQWVSEGLTRLIVASLAVTGGLAALIVIDPLMGGVMVGLCVVALAAGAALSGALTARIRDVRRLRARLASQVGDRLRTLAVVQLCGRARRERRVLARHSARLANAAVRRARVASIVRGLPDAVIGLSTIAILGIGGARLAAGEPAHGIMLAALSLLAAMAPQARALGRINEYRRNYKVAATKLRQILAATPPRPCPAEARPYRGTAGHLTFEEVRVGRGVSNFDATAEARALIAIVGPTGAGKSSLLAATARLLQIEHGRIRIDGRDISSFDSVAFARQVAMVSADLPLLKGTIRHNLTYRSPRATAADLARARRLAGVRDDEIERLPDGLDTRVTEQHSALPLGLRQRLSLARAVLGSPSVLLLDDSDPAGTDPAGRAALDRLLAARRFTTLMVTHDMDRARAADRIWFMEDGRLVESGPPERLLAGDSAVADFFRSPTTPAPSEHASPTVVRLNADGGYRH